MLVLKVRSNSVIQNTCFCKSTKALPKLCMPFHFKMTGASSTADARVKVPSFQKVTFFLKYEQYHMDAIHLYFCMIETVSDCLD